MPDQVQVVWHGVNDEVHLREFLSSTVPWGELDVRRDPRQQLVLRHDSFERTPWRRNEPLNTGRRPRAFAGHARGLKLDLKDGTDVLDEVSTGRPREARVRQRLAVVHRLHRDGRRDGFRRLRSAYPGAIVQFPIDFLAPLVVAAPRRARAVLAMLARYGISRFLCGLGPREHPLPGRPARRVGVRSEPPRSARPRFVSPTGAADARSLTADFTFPQWDYCGRGSGEKRRYHRYPKRQSTGAG